MKPIFLFPLMCVDGQTFVVVPAQFRARDQHFGTVLSERQHRLLGVLVVLGDPVDV